MRFAGLIFDLDGTLIDSERLAQEAGLRAFNALGVPADTDFMMRLVGKDFATGGALVRATFGDVDMAALDRLWAEDFGVQIHMLTPKPGARAVLEALKAQGVPVAVATSSRRQGAEEKLAATGLASLVGPVVTRDDVTRAKPDPEPYLTAAARLGLAPGDCLAIEDSPTGVASARGAGCTVLHVPDLLPAIDSPADLVADDLIAGLRAMGVSGLQ